MMAHMLDQAAASNKTIFEKIKYFAKWNGMKTFLQCLLRRPHGVGLLVLLLLYECYDLHGSRLPRMHGYQAPQKS